MARTKGSKGKKTLAKEMGMTLEQYETWLETGKKGMEKIKKKEKEVNESIEKQEKQARDMYGGYLGNDKLLEVLNLPLPELRTEEEIERESITLMPFDKLDELPKKKKTKETVECSRCHQTILGAPPSKINLTYITTQASYHRRVSEDRPLLCWNCLNKLNKLIDEFLLDDESGIPEKFKLK